MNNDTTYKIRPAGRHILTIGRDLIQDNYAAVVELVKNAYDADSPDVNIEFRAAPDHNGYTIVISDHGHGMSQDDVINKWLVPSTQDKIKRQRSPSGRTLQGSKGIGRYAASILGTNLSLETVTGEGEKTKVHIEWSDFEKARYLDNVRIPIKTRKVSEPHGTCLTIIGDDEFLARWNQERFDKLRFELKKLTSPIISTLSHENSSDVFRISLTVKGFPGVVDIEETVEPYPLLGLFDYKISGTIGSDGKGELIYSAQKAPNIANQKIPFDFEKPTDCGELDIDIRVYDREAESIDLLIKRGFKDEFGNYVGKNEARQILNANNGIAVYRNGFRIRPLGDTEFDWLKLNARRIQTPTRCIGSNQVIGYVQIQSEDQSGLIEKSARDGLRENQAFEQLKEITKQVISQLEVRRYDYRRKEGLIGPAIKVEQNLQGLFSFDELIENVQTQLSKGKVDKTTIGKTIELISQDAKEKNKVADEIRKVLAIYQGQATLGKIVNVILHESGQPLNCFKNDVPNLRYWYELFLKTSNLTNLKKLMPIAGDIEDSAKILVELFDKLDPLAAKKRSAKKPLQLKKAIQRSLDIFRAGMKTHKVSAVISGSEEFKFLCWNQDIHAIFTNLIDNSMYWMCEKEIPKREISIKVETEGDSFCYIDYRDTGPGIKPEHSELIFEPEFTTKPEGMGLGLAIAGEAAERNGLELKALSSKEGAYFRIEPKMESENE